MSFSKGFRDGFQEFGHTITNTINFVLLTIVYFIGVGPVTLVSKARGKRFLKTRADKAALTYWEDHTKTSETMEDCLRQF